MNPTQPPEVVSSMGVDGNRHQSHDDEDAEVEVESTDAMNIDGASDSVKPSSFSESAGDQTTVPIPAKSSWRESSSRTTISSSSESGNKQSFPDLDWCVDILEQITTKRPRISSTILAEQYTAAIGLLVCLRRDQKSLEDLRRSSRDGQTENIESTCDFPNAQNIPAMTAVVNNQRLFCALLSCLNPRSSVRDSEVGGIVSPNTNFHTAQTALFNSSDSATATATATASTTTSSSLATGNTRKRTLSMDGAVEMMNFPTSKATKIQSSLSPHISGGKRTIQSSSFLNVGTAGSSINDSNSTTTTDTLANSSFSMTGASNNTIINDQNTPSSSSSTTTSSPRFNLTVLAATILYVAFEPYDQWPVPLVEAYAVDTFGPRLWVDNPGCDLLTQNLALLHLREDKEGNDRAKCAGDLELMEIDAKRLSEFYRKQKEQISALQNSKPAGEGDNLSPVESMTPSFSPRRIVGDRTGFPFDGAGLMPMAPSLKRKRSNSVESDHQQQSEVPVSPKPVLSTDETLKSSPPTLSSIPMTKKILKPKSANIKVDAHDEDGSSSSSGEDEDMEGMSVDNGEREDRIIASEGSITPPPPCSKSATEPYPIQQRLLRCDGTEVVRPRFFGENLVYAHEVIAEKLKERMDSKKAKQQSGLLQCLPLFASIPTVRRLVTSYLEKWLQSPALAVLSRVLFSTTVQSMEYVDPPLEDDLVALDNILSMRLKANQFGLHIENIQAIAIRMPTQAVARRIYYRVLSDEMNNGDGRLDGRPSSDSMNIIKAVHEALPPSLNADGLASAVLKLFVKPKDVGLEGSAGNDIHSIRGLLQKVAVKLGGNFDACDVLVAMKDLKLADWDDDTYSWSVDDEVSKARLMFFCATLVIDRFLHDNQLQDSGKSFELVQRSDDDLKNMSEKLLRTRKVLLDWCCFQYAQFCPTSLPDPSLTTIAAKRNVASGKNNKRKNNQITGAGSPDYSSILDDLGDTKVPKWLNVIRCLLFLEYPGSLSLDSFLLVGTTISGNGGLSDDECKRIKFFCDYGADLDDEMIRIVLDSATQTGGMPHDVALLILENMFHGCRKNQKPSIVVHDPNLVWSLYNIVEYIPPVQNVSPDTKDAGRPINEATVASADGNVVNHIPRLAYPGMWWRVTCLALVLCGASTGKIGAVTFQDHPTLRALIKMITSDRYRFPTVDCDEQARDKQKQTEQEMRDDEAKVTDILFSPPEKLKKKKTIEEFVSSGSRVSMRQRAQREKILKARKDQEEAEARAEAQKRRKMLKAAQKSIMIWDPARGPRKPPKESADLLFAVGESFDLPRVFQMSTCPDYVMMTIGSTSRGAIERAYDWLIPIISFIPDTISRLPASASCFLLLQAYGTEGDEQSQLQKLSAPLLEHVHDSLVGRFGQESAHRAFELLLTEFSSHNPDKRRCARRVLQNAIGTEDLHAHERVFAGSNHTWVIKMLHSNHADSVVPTAIKHLANAASYERGSNLRFLVFALKLLTDFAKANDLAAGWNFQLVLTDLMSKRPAVFAAALSSFPQLCSLTIQVIHEAFISYETPVHEDATSNSAANLVNISICCSASGSSEGPVHASLPLNLLQSTCVVLSVWSSDKDDGSDATTVNILVNMMMNHDGLDGSEGFGLKSAKFADTGKNAVSVELWTMLAKSRSDFIAKRAALAAPSTYLPRLLLCSGLPKASLVTMIDRLGNLGDKSGDKAKAFNEVLLSDASSTWDIGRLGSRREIARKLLGRMSAYQRTYNLTAETDDQGELINFSFVTWLPEACQVSDKASSKLRTKFKKPKANQNLVGLPINSEMIDSIDVADSLLGSITNDIRQSPSGDMDVELDGDTSDMSQFALFQDRQVPIKDQSTEHDPATQNFILSAFQSNDPDRLDKWLSAYYHHPGIPQEQAKRGGGVRMKLNKVDGPTVAFWMMASYSEMKRKVEGLASILIKWIPQLTAMNGSPKIWKVLFGDGQKPAFVWDNLLIRCLQIWSHSHTMQCRDWLLSDGKAESLDLVKVARLFVHASTFSAIHFEPYVYMSVAIEDTAWARSEETVHFAVAYALDSLSSYENSTEGSSNTGFKSRNDVPVGLVVLILIAKLGKNQLDFVCNAVLERIRISSQRENRSLLGCLLRLYSYFPLTFNVGSAHVRKSLKDAVEAYSSEWLFWRSPLDDSIQEMIDVVLSPVSTARSIQTLADTAKRHPLLLLRKLNRMASALDYDAVARDDHTITEKMGLVVGRTVDPLVSKVKGSSSMKIFVKHWGFSYTENLWIGLLDILSSVPDEVLFGCGLTMGLAGLLDIYVRLAYIQGQVYTTGNRYSKLKGRFGEFLDSFQTTSKSAWDSWLASTNSELPSLGPTRNLLTAMEFITEQQREESIARVQGSKREY